jgi:hypothetical protein
MRPIDNVAAIDWLANAVMDPHRTTPIVCLTSRPSEFSPALDPDLIGASVTGEFILVFVPDGPRARQLAALLPDGLHVYGGSARIWWPAITADSRARDHPLIYDRTGEYGEQALEEFVKAWNKGPRHQLSMAGD